MIITGVDDGNALVLSYTAPSDGPAVVGADVQVPVQGLADDVARIAGGRMTGANIIRRARILEYSPDVWRRDGTTGVLEQIDVAITDDRRYVWALLHVPDGADLSALLVATEHPSVHAGDIGTKPSLALFAQHPSTGGLPSSHGTATKAWGGSSAAYGAFGAFGLTGLTGKTIDNDFDTWIARIDGEHGANALTGLRIHGVSWQFVTTRRDGGAA